jgi:acyl dehydratase
MRPTIGQQGLLYRLTGDKNPLHVDPAFARRVGFARPILHGLCTYGIVCKAAIDQALDGRAENVARYKARFAGTVFPGETIIVRGWREEEQILLQASTAERGAEVITNAVLTLRESAHAS